MPSFSIVIPCYNSAATLTACLASLDRQSFSNFEVLLVDSTPGNQACGEVANRFNRTRYYHHPHRLGAHAARNVAAQMAQGEILAFIDPDMTADPDWLQTFYHAFETGHHGAVGGGVDCLPGYWASAVHLTKYGWWLAGGPSFPRTQLPSGNFSLHKSLFLDIGGFPDRFWEGDTALSYLLREKGFDLHHLPDARTIHHDLPTLKEFLSERWLRGFDTAQARAHRMQWSPLHRAVRILAAPLTCIVMLARSARLAFASRWGLRWIAAAPVIALGLAAWVVGESRALAGPA